MSKRPSFQFYPGDWVRDSVAGCSLAAQGLWLRMMILAHDAERYGFLVQNGAPMPSDAIARRCGCTVKRFDELLQELDWAGVPSRTAEGIIYSRRMVRDEHLRELRAAGGPESLNHPNVARPKVKGGVKDAYMGDGNGTRKDGRKGGVKDACERSKAELSGVSLRVSPSSSSSSSNPEPPPLTTSKAGNSKEKSTSQELNPTEVAVALCQREGWVGLKIPTALGAAITHVGVGQKSPDFKAIGTDLVSRYHQHLQSEAKFPADVATFFSGAYYQRYGAPLKVVNPAEVMRDNLKAQQEALSAR